jgi:hypothetical protein
MTPAFTRNWRLHLPVADGITLKLSGYAGARYQLEYCEQGQHGDLDCA